VQALQHYLLHNVCQLNVVVGPRINVVMRSSHQRGGVVSSTWWRGPLINVVVWSSHQRGGVVLSSTWWCGPLINVVVWFSYQRGGVVPSLTCGRN